SVRAYGQLRQRFPALTIAPVYNDGIAHAQSLRHGFPSTSVKTMALRVPAFSPALRAIIDTPPFSFADFLRAPPPDMPKQLANDRGAGLRGASLPIGEREGRAAMVTLRGSMEDAGAAPHHDAPPPT